MPKVSKRRVLLQTNKEKRNGNNDSHGNTTTRTKTTMIDTNARKVSFEDGQSCPSTPCQPLVDNAALLLSSSPSSSSSTRPSLPRTSCCANMSVKNRVLTRKATPSLSLTQLAGGVDCEESPRPFLRRDARTEQHDAGALSPSSPWGQFVDVVPDDEERFSPMMRMNPLMATTTTTTTTTYSPVPMFRPTFEPYRKPVRYAIRRRPAVQGFLLNIPSTSDVDKAMKKMCIRNPTSIQSSTTTTAV